MKEIGRVPPRVHFLLRRFLELLWGALARGCALPDSAAFLAGAVLCRAVRSLRVLRLLRAVLLDLRLEADRVVRGRLARAMSRT
nr:hypothetical protein [uncultured Holophaga sp.]